MLVSVGTWLAVRGAAGNGVRGWFILPCMGVVRGEGRAPPGRCRPCLPRPGPGSSRPRRCPPPPPPGWAPPLGRRQLDDLPAQLLELARPVVARQVLGRPGDGLGEPVPGQLALAVVPGQEMAEHRVP